ncbi:hypothetical protein CJ030_MR5G003820 [Morella rubra]|uniref:Uncharacterized protein n=1 Tax=Morella rubra TaxID=262757 RepID=A0A6A1VKT8_9ROSI|nr:hypothetical protein CJ030_MR5G003820 [Morella rubra]
MESMKGIVIAYVIQIGLCTGTSGVSILPLVLVPQINPWPTAASVTLLDFSARFCLGGVNRNYHRHHYVPIAVTMLVEGPSIDIVDAQP